MGTNNFKLTPFFAGLTLAIAVFFCDWISKYFILSHFTASPKVIDITSFFNLILVWNKGISFSLLSSNSVYTPYLLSLLSLTIIIILFIWLAKEKNSYSALALGAIIGGASGNVFDRLYYGAVVDFLDFHIGTWHWPAFNFADSAICLGVFVLILTSFHSVKDKK